jgi:protein TonB
MIEAATFQARRHPAALTAVVLIHAAAIGALALSKMDVIKHRIPPTIVDFLEDPPPPPKTPVEKIEKVIPRQQNTAIEVPPRILQLPNPGPVVEWRPIEPSPVIIPEPGPVDQPKAADPPPPPPPPVTKLEPAHARANLASYVSDDDYPASAIRSEEQGTTRFRLAVGPDGRVKECIVTASSGSGALDSATCRLMKQRAKFTAARDSSGRPTSDIVASSIRWVLPTG